jgi:hypothetical protein
VLRLSNVNLVGTLDRLIGACEILILCCTTSRTCKGFRNKVSMPRTERLKSGGMSNDKTRRSPRSAGTKAELHGCRVTRRNMSTTDCDQLRSILVHSAHQAIIYRRINSVYLVSYHHQP